ncbi:MAG: hypothetical protein MUF15_17330 [Acidobacteria bacterium]|jgi:hypothetical protein|nr:hypothetical protein [Acidobacteriota bacterium]
MKLGKRERRVRGDRVVSLRIKHENAIFEIRNSGIQNRSNGRCKWTKRKGRSRSRFIEEEMTIRLKNLEDKEITWIYDELHSDPEIAAQDKDLGIRMGQANLPSPKAPWPEFY